VRHPHLLASLPQRVRNVFRCGVAFGRQHDPGYPPLQRRACALRSGDEHELPRKVVRAATAPSIRDRLRAFKIWIIRHWLPPAATMRLSFFLRNRLNRISLC
jgi:hypothetical protein